MRMNDLKKRMRHLWPLLLALVLTVTLFVACTGDTQDPSDSSASSDATSSAVSDSETADSSDSSGLPADSNAATEETQGEQTPSDSKDPDGSVSEDPSDSAEVSEETSVEEPTEEPTDPPVITVPSEDAPDEPAGTDSVPEETLPYDPDLHPGDASKYAGVLIHSVYGTGKKGAEALISNGYVQLYNKTDKNISLKGASLYYKSDGSNPFDQFVFPDDAVIPAPCQFILQTYFITCSYSC